MSDQLSHLIDILLDSSAREDERHDAVMDIGNFNDDRALKALSRIATNFKESQIILDSCGESIAQIWVEKNQFDAKAYKNFHPNVQSMIKMYLESKKPEWLIYL